MTQALLLAAVAVGTAFGTAAARAYALRRRLFDMPGERRAHAVATPRGGGVGPVIGILIAWMALGDAPHVHASVALAAVALIGAWDDHRPLPPLLRLFVHVGAGIVLAAGYFDLQASPLAFAFTVLATAVLVNVWNFMDGIDGIATSQAALVAAAAALLGLAGMTPALAVAVACVTFLPFNFPKARIFLGDVGSGALGVAIAALTADAVSRSPADALRLLLPASAFLVDAGLTLGRRMLRRERWWSPHAQHLYQVCARRFGHPRVTIAYAVWTAASVAVASLLGGRPALTVTCVSMWYTTAALLWLVLQRTFATGRDTH